MLLVEVDTALTLPLLVQALAALASDEPQPTGRDAPRFEVARLAREVRVRLNAAGMPLHAADAASLESQLVPLAAALDRLASAWGPLRWTCGALPWSAYGAPTATSLSLAVGTSLRRIDGAAPALDPPALALLGALGAFEVATPASDVLGRIAAHARAGQDDTAALHLLLLTTPPDRTHNVPGADEIEHRIAFELADAAPQADTVAILRFDIDDQTPEDLAIGLERVRAMAGVLDATLMWASGKKGRPVLRAELLVRPAAAPAAVRACLAETSTIGLRWHLERRVVLRREAAQVVSADSGALAGAVKTVWRPGGKSTTKAEAADLAASGLDYAGRRCLRETLEAPAARRAASPSRDTQSPPATPATGADGT